MTATVEDRAATLATKPVKAAVYLRQSLDRTGEGLAVARQREDNVALAKLKGWGDIIEYEDNDTSASKGVRPACQRMLRAIEDGKIDAVVVWDLDRLHRQPRELEDFIDLCDRKQVKLATFGGDTDLSTDQGRLTARIKGAVARAEIERKSARQKRASLQRAQSGKGWGPRAFGYNGEHANPAVVPDEAAAVRHAYHDVLAGNTVYSVAVRWNKAGFCTNKGNEWDTTQVKRLLLNPRYAGLRSYRREIIYKDGEPVSGDWPAMVDLDTWQALHYLLTNTGLHTAGRPARKYLLGSILVCGECGKPLSSGYTRNAQKASCDEDRPIYKCKNYSCSKVVRRQRLVDPWVQNTILNRIREKGWKLVSDLDPTGWRRCTPTPPRCGLAWPPSAWSSREAT
jgi:DNA invertase Pin-like site-specific DNA recombinase